MKGPQKEEGEGMIRKRVLAYLFRIVLTVTVLLALGGLGATVYELRELNESLESLKAEGLFVHGLRGPNSPITVSGDVDVSGRVDVGSVYGAVDVTGQVDVSSCNTRFVGCDPIEVIIVR